MSAQRTAVVIMYDVRGFSNAARRVPEAQFGAFMTSAHALVISFLFPPEPKFVKNLGDGNLLLFDLDEKRARTMLPGLVQGCVTAQREFRGFAERQSFPGSDRLPRDLGFGVTFGTVTRGDDWYGRAINLAARLTDCARPRGVILDDATFRLLDAPPRDEPIIAQRKSLKGMGRVKFHWIVRLTRFERARWRARRIAMRAIPVLLPLLLFAWIDGGLPFPWGDSARAAIDAVDVSVLRPAEDVAQIDARARAVHDGLVRRIARRFDRATGRVRASGSRDFFAAADGKTLAALADHPRSARLGRRMVRDVDQLFSGQRLPQGRRFVELRENRGFLRHPTEPYPHGESTAWVLLGLIEAQRQPAFRAPGPRARISRYTARTWNALRGFFDPVCGAWHWRRDQAGRNVYGRPQFENEHYASSYTAALAAWAILEARRNGVRLEGSTEVLRATVEWLVRHFLPDSSGWAAHYSPSDASLRRGGRAAYGDGLTMQIYTVLQLVELWAPGLLPERRLPAELTSVMHERVRDVANDAATQPRREHRWVVDIVAEDGRLRRVRDARSFALLPWAYAAARLHHDLHAATEREKVEARRTATVLLESIEERARTASPRQHLLELDEICAALAISTRRP